MLGYSVFAVTQADPDAPLGLPRTEADAIASTLPEPSSASRANPQSTDDMPEDLDIEDGDYELQVALQASLMNQGVTSPHFTTGMLYATHFVFRSYSSSCLGPGSSSRMPPFQPQGTISPHRSDHTDVDPVADPVAAGMERNRILLQRMRDEQEFAQREVWSETNLTPEEQLALNERREQRRKREEEEENELQRAIAESQALAQRHQTEVPVDSQKLDRLPGPEHSFTPYDDDPELQAALRASLEQAGPPPKHSDSLSEMDDVESVTSDSIITATGASQAAAPSLDEVRRRRLAKFDF